MFDRTRIVLRYVSKTTNGTRLVTRRTIVGSTKSLVEGTGEELFKSVTFRHDTKAARGGWKRRWFRDVTISVLRKSTFPHERSRRKRHVHAERTKTTMRVPPTDRHVRVSRMGHPKCTHRTHRGKWSFDPEKKQNFIRDSIPSNFRKRKNRIVRVRAVFRNLTSWGNQKGCNNRQSIY